MVESLALNAAFLLLAVVLMAVWIYGVFAQKRRQRGKGEAMRRESPWPDGPDGRDTKDESTRPRSRTPPQSAPATRSAEAETEADAGIACPDCGTANEPGFTYCRACVTKLAPPGRR